MTTTERTKIVAGQIYRAVYERQIAAGVPHREAKRRADRARSIYRRTASER